jgi:hypothetical protein
MPKLGKRTKAEEAEESSRPFQRLKNKHSAIESNISLFQLKSIPVFQFKTIPFFDAM